MSDDLLAAILDPESGQGNVSVDRDSLAAVHATLGAGSAFADFELLVLQAAADDVAVEPFALRVGQWHIDMPRQALQSAVATAVLAAVIAAEGTAGVSVMILAVILPFLLDVERIEPRGRDRIVLAWLKDLDGDAADPESAYLRLPEDLRGQLTLLEFADVWERLLAAGAIDPEAPEQEPERKRKLEVVVPNADAEDKA